MEYTKDIIFNIKYNEEKDCLELKSRNAIDKLKNMIKRNKIFSIISLISTILIIWDIILVSNFINLLNEL